MRFSIDSILLFAAALLARLFFNLYQVCILLTGLMCIASILLLGILILASPVLALWTLLGRPVPGWMLMLWLSGLVVAAPFIVLSARQLYRFKPGGHPISAYKKDVIHTLCSHFINWIGTIKYFNKPYALVEDPGSYRLKGHEIRQLIDPGPCGLQVGDIILRGYKDYLDGAFIQRSGGADGLSRFFSHAALYAGPIGEKERAQACTQLNEQTATGAWVQASECTKQMRRHDPQYFQTGPQMVIHSMAKGVHVEDILTFLRCDYVAVLRLPETFTAAPTGAPATPPEGKVSGFTQTLLDRLAFRQTLSRDEVVQAALRTALSEIGSGYDFLFEHVNDHHIYSCTELVYHCLQSVNAIIGLKITEHRFLKVLFKRRTVAPADLYKAASADPATTGLRLVWQNVGTPVQGCCSPPAAQGLP